MAEVIGTLYPRGRPRGGSWPYISSAPAAVVTWRANQLTGEFSVCLSLYKPIFQIKTKTKKSHTQKEPLQ